MSLREDYSLIMQEEGETNVLSIACNTFDHCVAKVLAALVEGDEAEAGRILRLSIEEDFRDEANAIQDSDPDWRIEAREIDNRDRARDMK